MINKTILLGNLGRDPELMHTKKGTPVCNLSVATEHRVKNGESWEKATEWHKVTVWGKQAELAAEYLAKGRQVYIEGRNQTDKWEKDGQTHYTTKVVAELVKFLGNKESGGRATAKHASGPGGSPGDASFPGDDVIPF
jgi:single-strand DNA-binding protein